MHKSLAIVPNIDITMAMAKVETKLKRCNRCKKWKDKSKFCRDRHQKDSLSRRCRKCAHDYWRKKLGDGKVFRKYFIYEQSHRVVDGVKQKRCRGCETWKAESEFYKKQQSKKDGLTGRCKKCADKASIKSRKKRLAIEKRAEA